MAPRKKKLRKTSTLPTSYNRLDKTKIVKSSKTGTLPVRKSGRLARKSWDRPVVQLKNGLVDVGEIPDYLESA